MLQAGCSTASGPGPHAGETYFVNAQRTSFYSFGPSQADGPDFALYRNQLLTMQRHGFGYSRVTVQGTGQTGWVSTDDIAVAPPSAQPTPSASPSRHHRHAGDDESRPPELDQSQIPLPEFPESKPPPNAPTFRY